MVDYNLPGSYFGMTLHGDPDYFKKNARTVFEKEVYEVPTTNFLKAFNQIATLNKNAMAARKALLPNVFSLAMARQLEAHELEFVLKFIDHGPGNVTYDDFQKGIECMKASCDQPTSLVFGEGKSSIPPRLSTSNNAMNADTTRHRRLKHGPVDYYQRALTSNQEFGWAQALSPTKGSRNKTDNDWHGRHCSDVTTNEGTSLSNKYGIIT